MVTFFRLHPWNSLNPTVKKWLLLFEVSVTRFPDRYVNNIPGREGVADLEKVKWLTTGMCGLFLERSSCQTGPVKSRSIHSWWYLLSSLPVQNAQDYEPPSLPLACQLQASCQEWKMQVTILLLNATKRSLFQCHIAVLAEEFQVDVSLLCDITQHITHWPGERWEEINLSEWSLFVFT